MAADFIKAEKNQLNTLHFKLTLSSIYKMLYKRNMNIEDI